MRRLGVAKEPDLKTPGRPLAARLGLKPGQRVATEDFDDSSFERLLREQGTEPGGGPPLDLLFFHVQEAGALGRLPELRRRLKDTGAIWVLRAKGAGRSVSDVDIIEAARAAGLVDNKIASFSEELAAMRLVVPLRLRAGRK